ncbi:MAG: YggS family pyridoxal phosphate-dependent enzyme [Bacteroidetes bacterium]|nr:YggS family pyridoxal phosphate-dependent enzyme [Bacteroidota bacterium]MCL2302644.1 YggS family pyridoxal phosphate-dependent enzyme [Lentimicrobiaceae bacterium]
MNLNHYNTILNTIPPHVKLVAVSKMRPIEQIQTLYNVGHRVFGENRPQEMKAKYEALTKDIEWHFIGHLQSNKIKYIAPFASLIHSIDSFSLLQEVNRYAEKNNRIIPCLLQFFIAQETSKYGLSWEECAEMLESPAFSTLKNINIVGVMGMATFTDDKALIRKEFKKLYGYFVQLKEKYFSNHPDFKEISMGMSEDYDIAIEEGSTIVRIGSAIFENS